MKEMVKKMDSFVVHANIQLEFVGVSIKAESLEDAISKSRSMIVRDFITVRDEHGADEIEIVGVMHDTR